MEVWAEFEGYFPRRVALSRSELSESAFNFAFLVKDCRGIMGSGIDQRDAAIIAGARKAIVILYKNGHLCIEAVSDSIEKLYPQAANQILVELAPQNNDAIVIAGADSPLKAKRGAFAASWSLID